MAQSLGFSLMGIPLLAAYCCMISLAASPAGAAGDLGHTTSCEAGDADIGSASDHAGACIASEQGDDTALLQHGASRRGGQQQQASSKVQGGQTHDSHAQEKRGRSLVDEVYTFGAPATSGEPFQNAASKSQCFRGLRSYTESTSGSWVTVNQVDAAAINNYYPHACTSTVALHWGRDSHYARCNGTASAAEEGRPDWPVRGANVVPKWSLHYEKDYQDRLDSITIKGVKSADYEPFKSARKFVKLAFKSYDSLSNTKKELKQKLPGWRVVQRVVYKTSMDTDPVMVVQEVDTKNCAFVFTGTNGYADVPSSIESYGTNYCGFKNVHAGYRNELWTLTRNMWSRVRPTLEKCNRVTCVGHSLGGSLCEIFAACANSGNTTDPDFNLLKWRKALKPTLMPEATTSFVREG